MRNPFVYNRPVAPSEMIDREKELAKLVSLADGGHSTRLSGPRRYGKTTLLKRLQTAAQNDLGMVPVYVDLYGVVSRDEVVERFEGAYNRQLRGSVQRAAINLVRTLRPKARMAPGGIGVEVQSLPELDTLRRFSTLLDLPVKLKERTGKRALIIFDEFQAILKAGNSIDGLIRSRIQHHYDAASYVFAGSHPGLMSELFDHRERAFYGQARPIKLGPLTDDDLADYISDRFTQGDRDVGRALKPLLALAQGHPQRAMLLANYLWELTPQGKTATTDTWAAVVDEVQAELAEVMQATWEHFTEGEQRVVATLATQDASLHSNQTLAHFNLDKETARKAVKTLKGSGDIQEINDQLTIVDPLLINWVKNRHS